MTGRSIDEILAAARARLTRVTPEEAFAESRTGAMLVDIRPASERATAGEIPAPWWSSGTTWGGGSTRPATHGCPA